MEKEKIEIKLPVKRFEIKDKYVLWIEDADGQNHVLRKDGKHLASFFPEKNRFDYKDFSSNLAKEIEKRIELLEEEICNEGCYDIKMKLDYSIFQDMMLSAFSFHKNGETELESIDKAVKEKEDDGFLFDKY